MEFEFVPGNFEYGWAWVLSNGAKRNGSDNFINEEPFVSQWLLCHCMNTGQHPACHDVHRSPSAPVSVSRVVPVPETFHSRYSAVSRAYVYRLGAVRPHAWPENGDGHTVKALTPIAERHRSFVVGYGGWVVIGVTELCCWV